MKNKTFNVRVEYESIPIHKMIVQCPFCNRWFSHFDVTENGISYEHQINTTKYTCPVCKKNFGWTPDYNSPHWDANIEETDVSKTNVCRRVVTERWVTNNGK